MTAELPPEHRSATYEARTGLQKLNDLGVPDGALTALLVLVTTLTVLPYIAGREFGPYTVPQFIPTFTFWVLSLAMPLAWVLLMTRVFGPRVRRSTVVVVAACLELLAGGLAFASSPETTTKRFTAHLRKGEVHTFSLILPSSQPLQRLETRLIEVEPPHELWVQICGGAGDENCKSEQRAVGLPFVRALPKGLVTIRVLNFDANRDAVDILLTASFTTRRFF